MYYHQLLKSHKSFRIFLLQGYVCTSRENLKEKNMYFSKSVDCYGQNGKIFSHNGILILRKNTMFWWNLKNKYNLFLKYSHNLYPSTCLHWISKKQARRMICIYLDSMVPHIIIPLRQIVITGYNIQLILVNCIALINRSFLFENISIRLCVCLHNSCLQRSDDVFWKGNKYKYQLSPLKRGPIYNYN